MVFLCDHTSFHPHRQGLLSSTCPIPLPALDLARLLNQESSWYACVCTRACAYVSLMVVLICSSCLDNKVDHPSCVHCPLESKCNRIFRTKILEPQTLRQRILESQVLGRSLSFTLCNRDSSSLSLTGLVTGLNVLYVYILCSLPHSECSINVASPKAGIASLCSFLSPWHLKQDRDSLSIY